MATIKSYTDLQQSKQLADILPLESADMCYPKDAFEYNYAEEPVCHYSGIGLAHPCWSLATLLGVLPKGTNISISDSLNKIRYSCWNDYDITYASNPVDACYEMIIKLHELNLL